MSAISCVTWQSDFLKVLPAVQTHAKIRFRRLRADVREEAIAEASAAACLNFYVAAQQGKLNVLTPGSLSDFSARHVTAGRHVGGRQDAAKDVLSPACRRRHGVTVFSIDDSNRADRGGNDWRQILIADRRTQIPDVAAMRIDFAEWLNTLSRRDRRIVNALAKGDSTMSVAQEFQVTPGRISQLRRQYERSWMSFQGEAGFAAVAA
jgi:hypothetical protein